MEFSIRVEELLSKVVKVEAENLADAIVLIENMYRQEEIVLDYSDFDGNVLIEECKDDVESQLQLRS